MELTKDGRDRYYSTQLAKTSKSIDPKFVELTTSS